jgi:NAD(P)-dependent dehydrogenase (short-subunit alcohol dehydrogenase family)
VRGDLGPVSVLVCNAAYMVMGAIDEVGPEAFWRVVDTNLTGSFNCIRACAPAMTAGGWGRIVTISSGWGVTGWARASAYSASKAGVISLTRAVARELGPHGVTANAVAPGVVDTPQLDVDADDAGVTPELIRARYGTLVPLGRVGRPDEVAAVVAHLCGAAAGTITGQVVAVNGGMA